MIDFVEKVKQIIVDELGVDELEVTENARFIEDLGADSLDLVELVMRFEEEFDTEIPDEDAERLQIVGDVLRYLSSSYINYEDNELILDKKYLNTD